MPVPASQLSTVNGFGVGPLVSSIGAHIDNTNRRAYIFQIDYDTAGTFGAVVKQPFTSPQSPSVLSLSAASFSARTNGLALPFGSGALNISTGFLDPLLLDGLLLGLFISLLLGFRSGCLLLVEDKHLHGEATAAQRALEQYRHG